MLLPEMTIDDAVAMLVDRHEMAGRVKQALQTPWGEFNMPDLTPHIQRLMTPDANDAAGQAARSGLIGVGVGGLAGAGSSMFGDRRRHWLRNALTGAMMGGAVGAAAPTVSNSLGKAMQLPESSRKEEEQQQQQYGQLDDFAKPDVQSSVVGGLTSPVDETVRQITGRSRQGNPIAAASTGAGLVGRVAAEGAVGAGLGHLASNPYLPSSIKGIGADVTDKHLGTLGMGQAIQNGARPWSSAKNHPVKPTWSNWRSLASKSPARPGLARFGGLAGAALPLIEAATGAHVDPAGWVQRMFSNGDKQ